MSEAIEPPPPVACSECQFGVAQSGNLFCVRYPPQKPDYQNARGFPRVEGDWWCGEFKARTVAPVAAPAHSLG